MIVVNGVEEGEIHVRDIDIGIETGPLIPGSNLSLGSSCGSRMPYISNCSVE